jgi:hypothetical protein
MLHMTSIQNFVFNAVIESRPTNFLGFEILDAPLFTGEGIAVSVLLIGSALTRGAHIRKIM